MNENNKSYRGDDAELFAMRCGQRDALLARLAGRKPEHAGNVVTTSAIAPGFFLSVAKKSDGTMEWLAVSGPTAHLIGAECSLNWWASHKGTEETRRAEFVEMPEATGN